jgi:hypothetical protein
MDDEMMMEEGSGTKCKPNINRMLNVFDLHFSAPEEKAVSRICASKTRRNLQTFGRCLQFKQSCPRREINAMGRVVLRKNVSEKLSIINPL